MLDGYHLIAVGVHSCSWLSSVGSSVNQAVFEKGPRRVSSLVTYCKFCTHRWHASMIGQQPRHHTRPHIGMGGKLGACEVRRHEHAAAVVVEQVQQNARDRRNGK